MDTCEQTHLPVTRASRVLRPSALVAFLLWVGLHAQSAHAVDCTPASDGASLAAAINQANAGTCDTINVIGYIPLASQDLPVIDRAGATITIQGQGGQQIVDGTGTSRLFAVINGDVTISDINIENGLAEGGDGGTNANGGGGGGGALGAGGGLFIGAGATVTLENVDLGGNTAQGGAGGDSGQGAVGSGAGGGGLNGGGGGSGSGAITGASGGGGAFGADGGGNSTGRGGSGGGGGGNNAVAGSQGTSTSGASGGSGDGGAGGAGSKGDDDDPGVDGSGMGGGGGGGSANNYTAVADGGDGGALGGGGGGGGEAHFVTGMNGTGDGGSGGDGGFGGGGGGGGSSFQSAAGTWTAGAGGLGGFGAGGGGGGAARGLSATPTMIAGSGSVGGVLGGDGGDGGVGNVAGGGGGGGAGLGGAIFVQNGGTLNIGQSVFFGGVGANAVAGGAGGSAGTGGTAGSAGGSAGANIYAIDGAAGLGSNATVGFQLGAGQTSVLTDADLGMLQAGYSGQLRKTGAGELVLQSTTGMTTGGWSVVAGILRGNTNNLIGALATDGQLIVDQGFNGTLAGDLTGSGSLVKAGSGNVTLSGNNDAFTGAVQIDAGTLSVNGSGIGDTSAVTVGGGSLAVGASGETIGSLAGSGNVALSGALTAGGNDGNTTYSGNISGSGSLTKTGTGTLTLSGTNSYTGGTTIDAGTLVGTTASLIGHIVNNSALVFAQTFDGTYGGDISGSGSLTKAGNGTLRLTGGNSYYGGTTITAGTLRGTTSNLMGDVVNNSVLEFDQATNGTYAGNISGSGGLTKSGSGTVTLSGTNSYSGGTTIAAGTLRGTTSSLVGDVVNDGALEFDQATNGSYAGQISGSGSLTKSGAGDLTLTGTNTYTGGTTIDAGTLIVTTSNLIGAIVNNSTLQFAQTFDGSYAGDISGSGGLVKTGTGTLTLAGANSYSGGTTITTGTLVGTTASLTGDIVNNGALEFDQATNGTHAGDISGTGSLTKSGSGTVTLSGTNSHTGGTTIAAGTLVGTTSSLTGDIVNNGALAFDQAFNGTYAGAISGSGGLTKSGSGTVTLSGTNSYTGGTTIDAGTLIGTTSSLIGAIVNNGALEFAQSFNGTYAGQISGSGGLTKSGTGTVTLTGTNSYTGGTTVGAGMLVGTTLSLSGDIINNAAVEFAQSADGTYAGDISGSGSLTKSGSGTLTLTGTHSYTGTTTIAAGTLTINGTLLSPVTVSPGARLTGSGNAGQVVADGIVAPGNSIGTMNVASLTLMPGAVFEIEFDDAGNSDRFNVTGTATLAGTLRLLPEVGSYVKNTQYLIIDAGSVSGTFDDTETINATRLGGLEVTVTITPTHEVYVELTDASFAEAAAGGSGGPVADYIDELRSTASGDLADVIAELEALPVEQIEAALLSLSPQTVDAIPTVQAAYGRLLTQVMERRLQNLRSESINGAFPAGLGFAQTPPQAETHSFGSLTSEASPSWADGLLAVAGMAEQSGAILEVGDAQERLWVQLIGEIGSKDDVDEFLGYDYQLLGAITGFEHRLSPEWHIGANVALGHSEVDFNHDRGGSDGMSYAGGAYLGWTPEPGVAIDLLGWGGITRFENHRNIEIGSIERQADGDTDVRSVGVELRGEMSGGWDAWQFDAFASASYTSNWQDAYCETGAGSANLCIDAQHTSEVAGAVGTGVSYGFELGSGMFSLDAEIAVTASQPLDDRTIRSRFNGETGSFLMPGDDHRMFGLAPKVGFTYQLGDDLSFSAHYSGHFGRDFSSHGVHAGLEFRF